MKFDELISTVKGLNQIKTITPIIKTEQAISSRLFFEPMHELTEEEENKLFLQEEEEIDVSNKLTDRSQITLVSKLMEFGANNDLLSKFFGENAIKQIQTAGEVACLREQTRR